MGSRANPPLPYVHTQPREKVINKKPGILGNINNQIMHQNWNLSPPNPAEEPKYFIILYVQKSGGASFNLEPVNNWKKAPPPKFKKINKIEWNSSNGLHHLNQWIKIESLFVQLSRKNTCTMIRPALCFMKQTMIFCATKKIGNPQGNLCE